MQQTTGQVNYVLNKLQMGWQYNIDIKLTKYQDADFFCATAATVVACLSHQNSVCSSVCHTGGSVIGVQGHSRSLNSAPIESQYTISY